jgi:hypothetical protein
MSQSMNKLEAIRVFMRVAELSSFSLAGKQLNKSPAAITRNVAMLEAQLNMRLMNRSTRSLSLTEAGKVYLDGFVPHTTTAVYFVLLRRQCLLRLVLRRCWRHIAQLPLE